MKIYRSDALIKDNASIHIFTSNKNKGASNAKRMETPFCVGSRYKRASSPQSPFARRSSMISALLTLVAKGMF